MGFRFGDFKIIFIYKEPLENNLKLKLGNERSS
jgi:hypothetical protein